MGFAKMFSVSVLGAFVAGMGLIAVSATVESEFIRGLEVFPYRLLDVKADRSPSTCMPG